MKVVCTRDFRNKMKDSDRYKNIKAICVKDLCYSCDWFRALHVYDVEVYSFKDYSTYTVKDPYGSTEYRRTAGWLLDSEQFSSSFRIIEK